MSEADPVRGADGGSTVDLIALTLNSSQTPVGLVMKGRQLVDRLRVYVGCHEMTMSSG